MSKFPTKTVKSPAQIPPKLAPLPNTILAFCDGACKNNPGKGGFGTVIILPTGEQTDIYGGEDHTTNNRMELMGAIAALTHSPPELPIQIWTDSGYVKDGITQWLTGWKARGWKKSDKSPVLNQELWQQLDQACQNRDISWHWLKGHAGHEGNEYADTLANLGVTNLPTPLTILAKKKPSNPNPYPNLPLANNSANPLSHNVSDMPMTTPNPSQTLPNSPLAPVEDAFIEGFFVDDRTEFEDMAMDEGNFNQDDFVDHAILQKGFSQNSLSQNSKVQGNVSQNSITQNPMLASNPHCHIDPRFQNSQGVFFAQDDTLIDQRPNFDGNTQTPNAFVPLLPLPKHQNVSNRQLIMDTETTGFEATGGDRIIEIGVVEMINRKPTGEKLHVYINPNKVMNEEVMRIHGITNEFLADKPTFEQIGKTVYDFMLGAELVAHNAPFDMSFLVAEFNRMGLPDFADQVSVIDSLVIAKQQYAGQRNTLDALVKRLNVGKQDRTFHGALLDAEILAEVYLTMTGGQVSLGIDDSVGGVAGSGEHRRFDLPVARFMADETTENAHLAWITRLKTEHPMLLERWGLAESEQRI